MGQRREVTASSWDREVTSAELPVLVEFWSGDSAPCRFEEPVLEGLAARNQGLKVLRVDVDAEPELVARYGVRALPTMVLFIGGVPLHRLVGYREPGELDEVLAAYVR